MNKEKRKRLIPLSDWVPKIMKYFSKSNRPATSRTQKKRKKSEIMNRKGIVESKWKTRGNHEGQSGEDQITYLTSGSLNQGFLYEEDGGSGGAGRYKGFSDTLGAKYWVEKK